MTTTPPGAASVSAGDVPPPPPLPLRERKRAATMRRIQNTAMSLFAQHGFDAVTIEQVSDAAEASPSTVYRYFGTKERLVLHDEFDNQVFAGLAHFIKQGLSPWDAVHAALELIQEDHFVEEAEGTLARTELFFANRSIQSAAFLLVDDTVEELARMLAETGSWSRAQARVIASSIIWPLISILKNWYHDSERPFSDHVKEAMATLDSIRPRP
ncbi:TetR/AcrR family transcriptional regulator [Nesterenkonia haasae]|uniref:TetR/AcrR family transcriptional regulator n=1 Tax=Nesterenkonia haasae TaxID=2587813 RepID=UPI001391E973|nr:TetR family transcriptional regulator [Nesterenkonia haasae]NDK31738.1 TetR family transcriptional regulator [Nesterenkonia haasae]